MIELFQNKNSATRFQIMVEIASTGPNIYQKNIASKIGISPQAVSEYIKQLAEEGLINVVNRSSYRVSVQGVNWMLKMLRELNGYISESTKAVVNITTCAAIAGSDLKRGQEVGLTMKDGLLFAMNHLTGSARGIAASNVKKGEDVGVSNIEGLVDLTRGKVTVLEVPGIQEGGSRQTDLKKLKNQLAENKHVGTIGIEALAALKHAGVKPDYLFGVPEAAIEAARCGLSFLIVCTSDAIAGLIKKIGENNLDYEIISLIKKSSKASSSL